MIRDDYKLDNSGNNTGLMIGNNTGSINFSIEKATKISSLIPIVIQSMSDMCSDDIMENTYNLKPFKPDEKIDYNCIFKYKDIIKKYSAYYYKCEKYLNTFDNSHIRSKAKILSWTNLCYMRSKGIIIQENKYTGKKDIDIIKQNSDKLIDMVQNEIYEIIKNSGKIDDMYIEDIDLGITCFICFCFMECKILEKPL